MIQPQTCLRVADNSGAKKLMCIRILGSNRRYGHVGDVIIGVVKDATPNLVVKRSDLVRAVIVRTKHSKKPIEVRNRIEELFGNLPRIELFAREKADGWDSWGNEIN